MVSLKKRKFVEHTLVTPTKDEGTSKAKIPSQEWMESIEACLSELKANPQRDIEGIKTSCS